MTEKNLQRKRKYSIEPKDLTNEELNYAFQFTNAIYNKENKASLIETDSNFSDLSDTIKTKLKIMSKMINIQLKRYRIKIDLERKKRIL